MAAVVADASVLIALSQIDRLTLLEQLFGEVMIPSAVAREVSSTIWSRPWTTSASAARRRSPRRSPEPVGSCAARPCVDTDTSRQRIPARAQPRPGRKQSRSELCDPTFSGSWTQVKALFSFRRFRIAGVIDAFSRMPLAMEVVASEPTASDVARLLARARRRNGKPRLLVSDQGSQFTAKQFDEALGAIPRRFGAVGRSESIALIDLEERLGYAVLHYSFFRPHRGLQGATPAEAFFGWPRAHEHAVPPPRGSPGRPSPEQPLQIAFLDPHQTYPILTKAA